MYLDHNENLRGQVVLIDPYIHKKTKLSRQEFLEKVKYVKHIRTAYNTRFISFYITSHDENDNLIKFHELVNKGIFYLKNYHVFAISVQPKLYNWFKTTSITTIQKQIACWLAGGYFFQPHKRDIMKEQIYPPLFEEIIEIVEKYYKDFKLPNFEELIKKVSDDNGETHLNEVDKCEKKYLQVCKEFYKAEPPNFLYSPFGYENLKEWGVNNRHNFEFVEAYFNEGDWEHIIKGNSIDTLHRSESRDDLWLKWKHVYSTFDQRKNFVYSFFFEPENNGKTPQNKKRELIPQEVKDAVWKRDGGMCVGCGNKEKLEFDHIIPFSKGGSSTYRNVQLLCELCNRTKHDNL